MRTKLPIVTLLAGLFLASMFLAPSIAQQPEQSLRRPDAGAGQNELTTAGVVARVQKAYEETRDFQAKFRQVYISRRTHQREETAGSISYLRPGRMRWDYTEGQSKSFVVNSDTLWVADHEEKVVQISEKFRTSSLSTAITFLWGEGKLENDFHLKLIREQSLDRGISIGDRYCLELTPKREGEEFDALYFMISKDEFQVQESVLYDLVGNINHIVYAEQKRNQGLAETLFQFQPPEGWRVERIEL